MKVTLIKIEEAAQAVGVNKKTLLRWEQQGYVHHVKKINGVRHYSMENIAQLIDLKRGPITYHLQMANYGDLPMTIFIRGLASYDDENMEMIPYNKPIKSTEELPVSSMPLFAKYRKRQIDEKEYYKKCNNPLKINYLLHYDESHQGPIIWSSNYEKNKLIKLKENSSCDVELWMSDFWVLDKKDPDNTQSIPPKSLIGIESKKTDEGYIPNFVLYERYGGHEWLADEIEN